MVVVAAVVAAVVEEVVEEVVEIVVEVVVKEVVVEVLRVGKEVVFNLELRLVEPVMMVRIPIAHIIRKISIVTAVRG